MTRPTDPVEGQSWSAIWTASAVARHLGIAPATLRCWSRRYGVGPIEHRPGSYRRYTDTDVAELETMRRLADSGMVLAAAAAVARSRHRGAPAAGLSKPVKRAVRPGEAVAGMAVSAKAFPGGIVGELVQAAHRLDIDTLVDTLDASLAERGVAATWNQLCRPALTDLDDELPPGSSCVDAELLLVWAVTTSLRRLPTVPAASPDVQPVLLACSAGEQHSLALEALLAALSEHHVPVRALGPSVPTAAVLHAGEHTHPAAAFIWSQCARTARPTQLRRLLQHVGTVVAAGPGWTNVGLPAKVRTANTLDEAVTLARCAAENPVECAMAEPPRAAAEGC